LINQLADAYRANSHVQPYVMTDLATIICRSHGCTGAGIYKKLADAKGFEFWQLSAEWHQSRAIIDETRENAEAGPIIGKPLII